MKIKTIFLTLILICSFFSIARARELTHNEKIAIANLKDNIKNGRIDSISDQIAFPLCRSSHPQYTIDTKDDFKESFNIVFDYEQKKAFLEADWYYHYGLIMNDAGFAGRFNEDGVLILEHIPLSNTEWQYVDSLVAKEKQAMHESVRNFDHPLLRMKVGKYLIRIDVMNDGSIRYVCWDKGADQSVKPSLVLYGGESTVTNNWALYTFTNNQYSYQLLEGSFDCSFTVSSSTRTLLDFEEIYENIVFYPLYDYSLSREYHLLRLYSDEAMEERGL